MTMKLFSYIATLSVALLTACGGGSSAGGDTTAKPQDRVEATGNVAYDAAGFQAVAGDAASLHYVGKASFTGRSAWNSSVNLDSYTITSATGVPVPAIRLPLSGGYHVSIAQIVNTSGNKYRIDIETNAPAGTAEVYVFAKGAAGASMAVRSTLALPAFSWTGGDAQAAMTGGNVWNTQGFAAAATDGIVPSTPGVFKVADAADANYAVYDLHVAVTPAAVQLVTGAVQNTQGSATFTATTVTPYVVGAGGALIVDLSPYVAN